MHINLEGQANDYVGKSMCGGIISIKPNEEF
jgi:glutamate synthase domain-containing protein 3